MSKRDLENEFEAKYNEYGNMLYKIAFLYLGNASDTEDVLLTLFLMMTETLLPYAKTTTM